MAELNNPINEEEKEELDMNLERINRSENDTNEHCEALCESEEIPEAESLLEAEEMYEEDESLLEDEEMYEEDELPEEDEESVAKMPEAEEESNSLEAEEKDAISEAERKRRNAERRRKRARQIRMEAPLDEYGRPIEMCIRDRPYAGPSGCHRQADRGADFTGNPRGNPVWRRDLHGSRQGD